MSETERVEPLRSEIDYDALIEKASPALRLYIGKLEQENRGCAKRSWSCVNSSPAGSGLRPRARPARKPRRLPRLLFDILKTSW